MGEVAVEVDLVDLSSGNNKLLSNSDLLSPSVVINSLSRPRSSRSPLVRRTAAPENNQSGFLAAERFPRSNPVIGREQSSSSIPNQDRYDVQSTDRNLSNPRPKMRGKSPAARSVKSAVASEKTNASKACVDPSQIDLQALMKRVKHMQNKAAIVMSEDGKCTSKDNKTPTEISIPEGMGRTPKGVARAVTETEAASGEDSRKLRKQSFVAVESCLRDVAETAVLIYREECARNQGAHRGDDKQFFMNSKVEEDQDSLLDDTESDTYDETREKSVSSLSTYSPRYPADTFRSSRKAKRFPEAIDIMDDGTHESRIKERKERRRSKSTGRIATRDKEKRVDVSPTIEILATNDHPDAMRALRLQLFKKDDDSGTVPKAQLSRALGELVMQDDTIETMQNELDKTKSALKSAEKQIENQKSSRKVQKEAEKLIEAKDRLDLEEKLKKRKEQNENLRARIADLQVDVTAVKAKFKKLKQDSENKEKRLEEEKEELQARVDIAEAKLRLTSPVRAESPNVVALRADVASLKAQLADANDALRRYRESRRISSNVSNDSQLVAMRAKLTRTEKELHNLRNNGKPAALPELARLKNRLKRVEGDLQKERSENNRARSAGRASSAELPEILRLRTLLQRTERELEEAKARPSQIEKIAQDREKRLMQELGKTEKALEERDASSRNQIEKLMIRIATAEREIADGRKLSEVELQRARDQIQKSKEEMQQLKSKTDELLQAREQQARNFMENQARFQLELKKSREVERSMSNTIAMLRNRVQQAEAVATRQRAESIKASLTRGHSDDSVTVQSQRSLGTPPRSKDDLSSTGLSHRRSCSMSPMRNAVRGTVPNIKQSSSRDDGSVSGNTNPQAGSPGRKQSGASLRSEVGQLRSRVLELIDMEKRSLEENSFPQPQAVVPDKQAVLETQNQSLQNELLILRARLAESEHKFKHERERAKEAMQHSKAVEAEQLIEVKSLKLQLLEKRRGESDARARSNAVTQYNEEYNEDYAQQNYQVSFAQPQQPQDGDDVQLKAASYEQVEQARHQLESRTSRMDEMKPNMLPSADRSRDSSESLSSSDFLTPKE